MKNKKSSFPKIKWINNLIKGKKKVTIEYEKQKIHYFKNNTDKTKVSRKVHINNVEFSYNRIEYVGITLYYFLRVQAIAITSNFIKAILNFIFNIWYFLTNCIYKIKRYELMGIENEFYYYQHKTRKKRKIVSYNHAYYSHNYLWVSYNRDTWLRPTHNSFNDKLPERGVVYNMRFLYKRKKNVIKGKANNSPYSLDNGHTYKPFIITISGDARSGKDTTAEILLKLFTRETKMNVNIGHFADYLKWLEAKYYNNGIIRNRNNSETRQAWQHFGTEVGRNFDKNIWIDNLIKEIELMSPIKNYKCWIIPDTRFKNEILRLKEKGYNVYTIKVNKTNIDNGLTKKQKQHTSENDLNNYKFNLTINNNLELKDLELQLNKIFVDLRLRIINNIDSYKMK